MDDKTLVERLRAWEPFVSDGYEVPDAGKAIYEAANTIEALQARVEALEAALRTAGTKICTIDHYAASEAWEIIKQALEGSSNG